MNKFLKSAIALAVAAASVPAMAATATDPSVQVTATVTANCTVTGGDISIATTPALMGSNLSNTASASVQCTNQTGYTLAFHDGVTTTDDSLALDGPGTDLNATLIIGANGTTNNVSSTGLGFGVAAQEYTLKALLNEAEVKQAVPGSYTGTATLTVTYN